MQEWLAATRKQGAESYARQTWPPEADSPTEKNYTKNEDFKPENYGKGNAGVKLKTTGDVVAVELGSGKKESELFKSKFGKIISSAEHKMLALKNALLNSAFLVRVPENGTGEIEIACSSKGAAGVHGVIIAGKNSYARVYQKQEGRKALVAEATEVFCEEGASLEFDYVQKASLDSALFTAKRAVLEKNAKLVWNSGIFGGKTAIATIDSKLAGEGSNAENYNAYFGRENQSYDISTNSFHLTPNTKGNLLSKGVLTGEAKSTYRGLIHIAKNARNTNCFLNGHALLLSDKAKANSVPSLEIFTNDVQSRHGATVEQIDAEKIFYLETRGFNKQKAVQTIVEGFVGEALQKTTGLALKEEQEALSELVRNA
ncbi:MAG: SufD family Fe-S cluster assembly protein [Candidatus Norongarragalinales archaeon]